MRSFLLALTFLTVIPAGSPPLEGPQALARAAVYFPLVGSLLGLLCAGFAYLALHLFPSGPVVILVLMLSFLLTRGLHIDGLADTVDGLAGGIEREKALKIMRDSAVGPLGAAAVFLIYLLKYVLLSGAEEGQLLLLVFGMFLAGRWGLVLAGAFHAPARNEGLGNSFLTSLKVRHFTLASLWGMAVVTAAFCWQSSLFFPLLGGIATALAASALFAALAARRLGGLTGDVLGAVNELAEAAFLLGAAGTFGLWL